MSDIKLKGVSQASPARRAAIIISVLGEAYARPIVARLDDDALLRVMEELQDISMIPKTEVVEIVIDFLQTLEQSKDAIRGGGARARALLSGMVDETRLKLITGEPEGIALDVGREAQESVWERLEGKSGEPLAAYLDSISPHLTSIVLKNLSTAKSSEVLSFLSEDKVKTVMANLVDLPKADDGLDMIVGRMIELEFLNNQDSEIGDAPHLASVGEVLSLVQKPRRNFIMDFLRTSHEAELQKIEHSFLSIERLPDLLSVASVPTLFREIDPEQMNTVYVCLKQTYPDVAEFLMSNISSRMADQIKFDTDQMTVPDQDGIDEIERDFLTRLMDLKRRDLIEIKEPPTTTA